MTKKPTVILLSAKAQCGKDFTATYITRELTKRGKKVLITHYADLLKYICTTFFSWDGVKDDDGRTLLQYVGTDIIRTHNPDYWVQFIKSILKMFPEEWDYILIPDTRFPNEVEVMKDCEEFNTIAVRINRTNFKSPLTEEQQNHPSETSLDNYHFDYYITNDSTKEGLKGEVVKFIASLSEFVTTTNKTTKKTIFCDLDGVVFNTIKCITEMYNIDFMYYSDFKWVDWTDVRTWNFSELKLASAEYIDNCFNQFRFFKNVELFDGAKVVLDKLSEKYNIVFVSHGNEPNLKLKELYVEKYFPYAKFIGIDLKKHTDKSSVDMSNGIFIDDLANNLNNSNAEMKICFGDTYSWNEDFDDLLINQFNAYTWEDVEDFLL